MTKRVIACALLMAIAVATPLVGIVAARQGVAQASGLPRMSISHYVGFTSSGTTISELQNWATQDAAIEDPAGDNSQCAPNYYGWPILTTLDFGQPWYQNNAYGMRNWTNTFYTDAQIANFTTDYAIAWYNASGACAHLTLAIGSNNSNECNHSSAKCIYNAGYAMAGGVDSAEKVLKASADPDIALQIAIIGGSDIEDDSIANSVWDSYGLTANFINGYSAYNSAHQTNYNLLDYGAAFPCSSGPKCGASSEWTAGQLYEAAWGLGWDTPLPEVYGGSFAADWLAVYNATTSACGSGCVYQGPMQFQGAMNDDGANDQYAAFASTLGSNGTGAMIWDTCMPSLSSSMSGGYAPCP